MLLAFAPFFAGVVYPIVVDASTLPQWYGLVPFAGVLCGIGAMSVSYHLAHAADRRAAAALGHWGAARGLALKPSQSPDEGSCLLLDRTDAIHGAAVRGTAIGARNGWVAHVGLPVRRYRALYAVPMLGPLADQRIDDWTLVQAVLTPGEVAPLRRLVLSRRDLLDLPALRGVRDAISDLRTVELESLELEGRYALLVDDDADDVAVRAAFTPALIVFLIERLDDQLLVELRRRTLTVAARGRATDPALLDRVLEEARLVAGALAPATLREASAARAVRYEEPRAMGRFGLIATAVIVLSMLGVGVVMVLAGR